jgi:predicted HicB family RNase H-like nuclease
VNPTSEPAPHAPLLDNLSFDCRTPARITGVYLSNGVSRQRLGECLGQLHLDAVNTAHYTYRVSWSAEDGEFVATCLELPSLSWLASTQVKALSGIRKLVDEVFADLVASGEDPPVPLAERHYSGRFNIRISPGLHRELTKPGACARPLVRARSDLGAVDPQLNPKRRPGTR